MYAIGAINHFSTAVSIGGQTTLIPSDWSPKQDWGPKRVNCGPGNTSVLPSTVALGYAVHAYVHYVHVSVSRFIPTTRNSIIQNHINRPKKVSPHIYTPVVHQL